MPPGGDVLAPGVESGGGGADRRGVGVDRRRWEPEVAPRVGLGSVGVAGATTGAEDRVIAEPGIS
jgi:hypothetical protein